ncbi:MAG: hypothetical protein H6812_01390 [Phycisphaeraceae bacterium]|nr:hypothetical protein [Phycisphaeraceae bacterium]
MTKNPSTRWKWARRIVLCLILGAIVNVAVAWTLTQLTIGTGVRIPAQIDAVWPVKMPADTPAPNMGIESVFTVGVTSRQISSINVIRNNGCRLSTSGMDGDIVCHTVVVHDAGWPQRSMRCWRVSHPDSADTSKMWHYGFQSTWTQRISRKKSSQPIPLLPIPLGFTINTLFYATLLFLPLFGIAALKRYRRVKRGLCRSCAYDLAGLATCPECGATNDSRSQNETSMA